jgi:hypothetical protein
VYPCGNYEIVYAVTRIGFRILVSFQRVDLGGFGCAFAIGPARCDVDLGALEPGTYSLTFFANTGTTNMELVVDRDFYEATRIAGESVSFTMTTLRRVPEGTVWGLIGYSGRLGGPQDSLAAAFLDSLAVRGAQPVALDPGEYGAFYVDSLGEMQWPGAHGYTFAAPFVRHYTGASDSLGAVVAYFGRVYGEWLSVRLLTWRGDYYATWVANTATRSQADGNEARGRVAVLK